MHRVVEVRAFRSQEQPSSINGLGLVEVLVGQEVGLPRLEAVLTFALVEDIGLELLARVLFPRHGAAGEVGVDNDDGGVGDRTQESRGSPPSLGGPHSHP